MTALLPTTHSFKEDHTSGVPPKHMEVYYVTLTLAVWNGSVRQSVSWSVSQLVGKLVSRSVGRSVGRSVVCQWIVQRVKTKRA